MQKQIGVWYVSWIVFCYVHVLIDVLSVLFDVASDINLLMPTGYVMHQQFNIQQLYALPTLYLCV